MALGTLLKWGGPSVLSIGAAIVLVPMILNYGFGYIDTVDRVGNGEDVEATAMLDAGSYGIRPGQTSQQAERVLGADAMTVASSKAGERCRGRSLKPLPQQLIVCFGEQPAASDGSPRWVVTRAWVGAATKS
jgi:hypothetical protein